MNLNQFNVKIHKMSSGHIQVKFFDPKTGKRKRKRFATLKDAKDFKKSIETKVNSKGVNVFSDVRVSEAMKLYLEIFPASLVRSRKNHFKSFIDAFGLYRIGELTVNDLKEWFQSRKTEGNLSERTMNGIKTQFYRFFEYLHHEDYLQQNPLDRIKFKRYDNPRRKRIVMSVNEVLHVLESAKTFSPDLLYPFLAIAAHTGARRGEIVKLNRDDIDFETDLIHFRETKNSHERFVKISPVLKTILEKQLAKHEKIPLILNEEGERIGRSALTRHITKFKAFFPNGKDWASHCLRHSFAYNFLKKSGKMYQLQAILGHRSIDVTVNLYGQLQAQDIECPSPYDNTQNTKEENHE
ncbi:MAG: tyrosine-type recombinase/integrase [Bacteriovoracia bacterium]